MIRELKKQFNNEEIMDKLPFVLMEIRNYTNQYFLTKASKPVISIEDNRIYLPNSLGFETYDIVEILNSDRNIGIYVVKEVGTNYLEFFQELSDEETNNMRVILLSFKKVNIKTIINMLKYSLDFQETTGIRSQTLGGYRVEYASSDGVTLFPTEMYGAINSLRKLNDDYAEYRRKGYVRL